MAVLSEASGAERFRQAGHVLLRNAVPAEAVAQLADFAREHDPAASPIGHCPALLHVQFAPAAVEALRDILGESPLPLGTGHFRAAPSRVPEDGGSPLNPHTHNPELVVDPPGGFAFVWVALQDVEPDHGPMWIAPDSHQRSGTQGMAFITTGAGNDTITLGGSGSTASAGGGTNTVTGGTGSDTFVLPKAS